MILDASGSNDFVGLEVDVAGGKIYWIDNTDLYWANLDGSGQSTLITSGLADPQGLGLDLVNGHLYIVDDPGGGGSDAIYRVDLDGGNFQTILTNPAGNTIVDVAVDGDAGMIYFSVEGSSAGDGQIYRHDLATSVSVLLIDNESGPQSISMDYRRGQDLLGRRWDKWSGPACEPRGR